MRYELTDYEWAAIKPLLPNQPQERFWPRQYVALLAEESLRLQADSVGAETIPFGRGVRVISGASYPERYLFTQ